MPRARLPNLPALLALLLASPCCLATLGGNEASVSADAARLDARTTAQPATGYRSTLLETPAGTQIREHVNAAGIVFAITWSGPVMPDLAVLLGTHHQAVRDAIDRPGPGRSNLTLRTPELVVQSAGRMRAFRGRAYLPAQLPAGVHAEELP